MELPYLQIDRFETTSELRMIPRRDISSKITFDASDILSLRWRKFLLFRGEIIISMFPLSWEMMERTSLAFVLYLFSRHVRKSLAM